jgi:hypothetical protein
MDRIKELDYENIDEKKKNMEKYILQLNDKLTSLEKKEEVPKEEQIGDGVL